MAPDQSGTEWRGEAEVAHRRRDLAHDIQLEKDHLQDSISHDYATDIVPLEARRPLWHFQSLFLTLWAGFPYLFLGFALHDGGMTLAKSTLVIAIGTLIYMTYGMFAAYLGSRTGQTHSLLTRSIFGVAGSGLVSVIVIFTQLGWAGFQGNLTVQMWSGLYGWDHVLVIGVIVTVLMITNNVFGFSGITAIARYFVTPLMFFWIMYLLIKAFTTEGDSVLGAHPHSTSPLALLPAIGLVIGFASWGAEPDMFRYAKPRFWWPLSIYGVGLFFGFFLNGIAGWIMAQLAGSTAFGPAVKAVTEYSLFGAFWLAFIVILVGQVSNNDGNYYEATNAAQNLLGGIRRWNRLYTCAIVAALGGLAAWVVPYVFTNGFTKIAAFGAIGIPTATVIMVTDHFVLPRVLKITRPLDEVPTWGEAGYVNWPALMALVVAVVFGAWASGIIPGEDPSTHWGIAPIEAWLLGSGLYVVFTLVARAFVGDIKRVLGFSVVAATAAELAPPGAIVDVATKAARRRAAPDGTLGESALEPA